MRLPQTIKALQVGPSPRDPGGMASVIAEYLEMSDETLQIEAATSWVPGRPVYSMLNAVGIALRVLLGRIRPSVLHVHVSERGSFIREGLIIFACNIRSLPVVASLHGADFPPFARRHPRLTRRVLGHASLVLCLGPKQRELIEEILPGHATTIVLNPVSIPQRSAAESDTRVAIFAGEVGTRKGFDRLANAWPHVIELVPFAKLVVCGPLGDLTVPDDPTIVWMGPIPRPKVRAMYATSALTLLPSRREVLPMTLLESLATGTRVLTTPAGECDQLAACPGATLISEEDADSPRAFARTIAASLTDTQPYDRAATVAWVNANASPEAVKERLRDAYGIAIAPSEARHSAAKATPETTR